MTALYFEPARPETILAVVPDAAGAPGLDELADLVHADPGAQLVILGPTVTLADAVGFAALHRLARPSLGVVLLRDQVDVAVLAEAIRSGVREVLTATDVEGIRAACARSLEVSRQLVSGVPVTPPAPREGQVLTVFAGKGGCGKSTVASNLAVALAAGGTKRVLLVDLDLSFGDIAIMLQLVPRRTIADAVPMAGRLDETGIRSLVTPYQPGHLDTLLAPPGPAEGERVGRELVDEILGVAKRMYDYVVVDTPPFFSDQVLAALDVSQWYLLVATPDVPSLKNLRLTLNMFDLLEYPPAHRLVVLNRSDAQVGLTQADIDKVIRAPINGRVPSTRDVPVSINRGVPLMVSSPQSAVSRCIQQLIDSHLGLPERVTHKRRSLLRRGR